MKNNRSVSDRFPSVAVIIVTWNKKSDVLQVLNQLRQIEYPQESMTVIVVDNASTDGTADAVESLYPNVYLIRNSENLGGAGGFNAGMRRALEQFPHCRYLWLLDNDVLVDKHALSALVKAMEDHPTAAVCGSTIMNRDNPKELIEIGAFIDYQRGDIRRNEPDQDRLRDPTAVFDVDYVAACSLLARTDAVKRAGIWREDFFIYWDDMEWGARFNSLGYRVIASTASIVYHPSWAGRVSDNTAIWRNYYRSRNSLWFFNCYTKGFKKRLLLSRMTLRYLLYAAHACINSHAQLSAAFINGIDDFFHNRFGKKSFRMPPDDIETFICRKSIQNIAVFIPDASLTKPAQAMVKNLIPKFPHVNWIGVVPKKEKKYWEDGNGFLHVFGYQRTLSGKFSWLEKFRILNFFRSQTWELLITPTPVPRMASIWRKPVACFDFGKSKSIAIEQMNPHQLIVIPVAALSYLFKIWTDMIFS